MSHAEWMTVFDEKCTRLLAQRDTFVHPTTPVGVHGMDNSPSMLFDYTKSAPLPAHYAGEKVHQRALAQLQEWNVHDSVGPLMHDGKTMMSFSIMLHESKTTSQARDVVASDGFEVDVDEPDGAEVGESHATGQVGYKESQQLGLVKQGKADYTTVDNIQQAYNRVVASLHRVDFTSGRKQVAEHASSQWNDAIGQCPNAMDLFNVLNQLPYANDRSPDVLVIASLAISIPHSSRWLPTLLTEHFEHGVDSDEWRKAKIQPFWRLMVDTYMQMMSPYLRPATS